MSALRLSALAAVVVILAVGAVKVALPLLNEVEAATALPWFALIGAGFVLAAVALQIVHRRRSRRKRPRMVVVPDGVTNIE
ncbi:MAG: hypothetical protein R3343_01670 [Nitriliruptorales bacterium]|nr:hypothetical protein [Nitriliruptorales bacterium]